MSDQHLLIQQKVDQAIDILNELDIDVWMTFVRETSLVPDPALDLILGLEMVWQSAFILTRKVGVLPSSAITMPRTCAR